MESERPKCSRSLMTQLELNLARDAQNNRKSFCRSLPGKIMEQVLGAALGTSKTGAGG